MSEDSQIKPDFKATAFVSFNHENLRQGLAAGKGDGIRESPVGHSDRSTAGILFRRPSELCPDGRPEFYGLAQPLARHIQTVRVLIC